MPSVLGHLCGSFGVGGADGLRTETADELEWTWSE